MLSVNPQQPVRPHVVSPETGETILLEDAVADVLSRHDRGVIQIVGGPGAGKTVALQYLHTLLDAECDLKFVETGPDRSDLPAAAVFYDRDQPAAAPTDDAPVHSFRLTGWGSDEFIEYLLAAHPERCASVMARLRHAGDSALLAGVPELCRPVLDRLAGDESITSALDALRHELRARLKRGQARLLIAQHALACLQRPPPPAGEVTALESAIRQADCDPLAVRLARHEAVRVLLAADLVLARLRSRRAGVLARRLPVHVVDEIARHCDLESIEQLEKVIASHDRDSQPMAASILVARDSGWRWTGRTPPNLRNAWLDDVEWDRIRLAGGELAGASLTGADLSEADLDGAYANAADFSRACLNGASLVKCTAMTARFRAAGLERIQAELAKFTEADFEDAILNEAVLRGANLAEANLTSARFCRASLREAVLEGATVTNADFSEADLTGARLAGLSLCDAALARAVLRTADLSGCDLEYLVMPDADLEQATLERALLTGSVMPRANLRGADLRETGLAEVEWPDADLREADLRGASFHLGSSRSGLVFSPYVSEGTRTGFYTDDFDEQHYRAPEEIRKANLRGADLREARIDGVDFYLVDLRNAKYSVGQQSHFVACGAILSD